MTSKIPANLPTRADAKTENTLTTFHPFPRLPPELRLMIWESAFPEITLEGRVFELEASGTVMPEMRELAEFDEWGFWEDEVAVVYVYDFSEGRSLKQQTLPLRTLGAINHETRNLLRRTLPDSLFILSADNAKTGYVRLRKETDIIYFDDEPDMPEGEIELDLELGFKNTVQNVAFNFKCDPTSLCWFSWLLELPHLKRFYYGSTHMAQGCQEEHKRLSNLEGCLQHGIFRYPTTDMVRNGPASRIWDGLDFLPDLAAKQG